jgi:hypothetical protein
MVMVRNETQGLRVALVLFVMVTVVLAVTTFAYFRQSQERLQERQAAAADARQKAAQLQDRDREVETFRHVLGYEAKTPEELDTLRRAQVGNTLMQRVWADFDRDMVRWGSGLGLDRRDYRAVPERLVATLTQRNVEIADLTQNLKTLTEKHRAELATERALTAQVRGELTRQAEDYSRARAGFAAERARIDAEKQQLAQRVESLAQAAQETALQHQQETERLTREARDARCLAEQWRDRVERDETRQRLDRPVGKIDWVGEQARLVRIDLGRDDGLSRQMTFSICDPVEAGLTARPVKGRIEVTRIIGPREAEARIVAQTKLTEPIMAGDPIFSPTFQRGQQTHFALAGRIDLRRSGKNDRERLKSIISLNGGTIDAEQVDDGRVTGKMTVDTRYLVVGEKPDEKSSPQFARGYTEMLGEATRLGIPTISVRSLLDRLGYDESPRVLESPGAKVAQATSR